MSRHVLDQQFLKCKYVAFSRSSQFLLLVFTHTATVHCKTTAQKDLLPAGHVARRKVNACACVLGSCLLEAITSIEPAHFQDVVHMGVLRCSERLEVWR